MKTFTTFSKITIGKFKYFKTSRAVIILLFMFLLVFRVNSQPAINNEDVKVWAVPGEQKVRPADKPEATNLVWSADKKTIKVAGAGNEHVPFQVVISAPVPPGWRPKAPDGFFVKASDLKSENGKIIPQMQVSLYLEHYIQIYAISSPIGATGYWPDALAPLKEPFSMQAQYHVVGNRPVWIDIFIPAGTPKGTYKGTVTVTRFEKVLETLGVEVEVYGFSLPEETHLITYVNISKGEIARFYNKPVSSPEIDQLSLSYFEFLSSHRMETWFNDPLVPELVMKGENIEVKFNDERYAYFLNKMKLKRVILETVPHYLEANIKAEPFSPEFNKQVKSYLSAVEAYFKKNGWRDRLKGMPRGS